MCCTKWKQQMKKTMDTSTAQWDSGEDEYGDQVGGGTIAKVTVKYFTKGEAELKAGKAEADSLFKAIEAYVLANPHYN